MIYLDYNATSPLLPEAFEAMRPYLTDKWGNPSSSYTLGTELRKPIEAAREAIAALIGAFPDEILFTSGATESCNAAIFSALQNSPERKHLIITAVEHSAVLASTKYLSRYGYEITYLPVDSDGQLSLTELRDSIRENTVLISAMWANNETGVVFPITEISAICREANIPFLCDAVQAVGRLPIDTAKISVDYLSLSAHKIGGPKGIGALYIRRGTPFHPYLHGGSQENRRRGGTENVPGIIGFGSAAIASKSNAKRYPEQVAELRNYLESSILNRVKDSRLNGHKVLRLPNTSNISFSGVQSDALLLLLERLGVYASAGSACLAESSEPSHVIQAMRQSRTTCRDFVRFSIGLQTTKNEINTALLAIDQSVSLLRDLQS